jgi:hypothetical protein
MKIKKEVKALNKDKKSSKTKKTNTIINPPINFNIKLKKEKKPP